MALFERKYNKKALKLQSIPNYKFIVISSIITVLSKTIASVSLTILFLDIQDVVARLFDKCGGII